MSIKEMLEIDNENDELENEESEEIVDIFKESENDIDDFNEYAWNKGDGFKFPNYPEITERLEGLESGLYLFAGASNHGKTAIMINLGIDAVNYEENNLFCIYFSLDDSRREVLPRIIAMNQMIPIGVASKPQRYQNMINAELEEYEDGIISEKDMHVDLYRELLRKRQVGVDELKTMSNKLKVIDSSTIVNTDDMHKQIVKIKTFLEAVNPDTKIIILIDSINDMKLPYKTNDEIDDLAKIVKRWTVEFDCPIFASTHIRKLNANRRPTLDDLKESNTLVYEASVTFIVYNDVSANSLNAGIYYKTDENDDDKKPILEMHWAKNKKSSYKGETFNMFIPEYSKTSECNKQVNERYRGILYQS